MKHRSFDTHGFLLKACLFEASLILVALGLGWIADIRPFEHLRFSEGAIGLGLVGTVPLFVLFVVFSRIEVESFKKIRRLLLDTLGPSLHRYHWTDLFVLAAIAGIAEEVLFRGVVQPWMESAWGLNAGLIGSNLVFGLVHAVTPLYALLAALVGLYLGLFFDAGGERNLLVPIVIHGLYDFLAFLMLMRDYKALKISSED